MSRVRHEYLRHLVKAILNDLSGRKGVGDELDQIDEKVKGEMHAELVALVERELNP